MENEAIDIEILRGWVRNLPNRTEFCRQNGIPHQTLYNFASGIVKEPRFRVLQQLHALRQAEQTQG